MSVDLLLEESEKTFEDMQLKRLHGSLLPLKGIENLPHPFIFHSLSLSLFSLANVLSHLNRHPRTKSRHNQEMMQRRQEDIICITF